MAPPKKRGPRKGASDDDAQMARVFAEVESARQKWEFCRTVVIAMAVPLSLLALWPLAVVLGGQETVVNVNVAISLSIAFAITTAGAGTYARRQKQKAADARSRVSGLESQVLDLQQQLEGAELRATELQADLTGVRADLGHLRSGG